MGTGKNRAAITKRELSQLYYLSREIEQDRKRLEELEAAAQGITQQITGMPPAGGAGDKVGKYAAEIADLRAIIEHKVQQCWYELNRLNRFIASVEDSQMRQILTLRYINHMTWQKIAFEIEETDESYPRRKHNAFLSKLPKMPEKT